MGPGSKLASDRTPGRALDIGAGEGADANRLALLGDDVDAMEVSKAGAGRNQRHLAVEHLHAGSRIPRIRAVYAGDENGTITSCYRKWRKEFIYFERDKTAHSGLAAHRHTRIKLIAAKS